jgi:uncharacterized membrane protein YeaQ/YmgE (transglycosylase-associated protein family)
MNIFIILAVGLFFGWLADVFIEGHGLGYAMDLVVATVGATIGIILYNNTTMPVHTFSGRFTASVVGALICLAPVIFYSSKRNMT